MLERRGKCDEAEVREKFLRVEHPYTLTTVRRLGAALSRQGKYEEADTMHRRALKTKEEVLGREHPDTLTSVNNLGTVL